MNADQNKGKASVIFDGHKFKEALIYSEIPVAQGCATIFQSRKRLKNEEKKKSHFCFSSLKIPWMELFRVYLILFRRL